MIFWRSASARWSLPAQNTCRLSKTEVKRDSAKFSGTKRASASRKKGLAPNRPSHAKRLPIVQIKAKSRFGFSFMDHSLNERNARRSWKRRKKRNILAPDWGQKFVCVCKKFLCVKAPASKSLFACWTGFGCKSSLRKSSETLCVRASM